MFDFSLTNGCSHDILMYVQNKCLIFDRQLFKPTKPMEEEHNDESASW